MDVASVLLLGAAVYSESSSVLKGWVVWRPRTRELLVGILSFQTCTLPLQLKLQLRSHVLGFVAPRADA